MIVQTPLQEKEIIYLESFFCSYVCGLNFSHFHSNNASHFGALFEKKNEQNWPSSSGGDRVTV